MPPAGSPLCGVSSSPTAGGRAPQICPGPIWMHRTWQTAGPRTQNWSSRGPQPRQAPEPSGGPGPQVGAVFPPDQEEEGPTGNEGGRAQGEPLNVERSWQGESPEVEPLRRGECACGGVRIWGDPGDDKGTWGAGAETPSMSSAGRHGVPGRGLARRGTGERVRPQRPRGWGSRTQDAGRRQRTCRGREAPGSRPRRESGSPPMPGAGSQRRACRSGF